MSYIPLCADPEDFTFLVRHEALGHAFAKLADENSIEANGQIPSSLVSDIKDKEKDYFQKNFFLTLYIIFGNLSNLQAYFDTCII